MTEQHAMHQRGGSNVLYGALLGALLAIVIGAFPASGWVLAPALIVALAVILLSRPIRYRWLAAFGGVLLGAGVLFAYGVVNTVVACVGTTDFCGRADVLPLMVLAVAFLATGGLAAVVARRRARP